MKTYALGFDFYDRDVNKFHFSIIEIDLNNESLVDRARQIIKDNFHNIDHLSATIKVTLFNNIET